MRLARLTAVVLLVVSSAGPAVGQPSSPAETRPANRDAMYEFLMARRAEAADDTAAAQAALERAIALDPGSAELRAELAGFFARQNRAADAVAAADKALALDPESEEGHRILGLVYAAWADGAVKGPAGGNEDDWRKTALEHLNKVQGTPTMATDLGLQITYARQLLAADDAAAALPVLERVVAQTGSAVEPLTMLAEAHRATGNLERATALLEDAAESSPRLYLTLGALYEQQQRWEDAAGAYEKGATATRAPVRELRLRRAAALLNLPGGAGAPRAIETLKAAVAANARDVAAQQLLAQAYLQQSDLANAETAVRGVLAVEPRNLAALGLLAGAYNERYAFGKVVDLLRVLDVDDPPDKARTGELVRLLALLGGARQQEGDAKGAVRTFARAQRLLPNAPPLFTALAQAYVQAREFDDAQRVARDGRAIAPEDLGLIRVEAIAGIKAGRPAPAVAAAEKALATRRDDAEAAFVLADVYQEARRFDDAVKVVGAVAARQPTDDAIALRLGAAYESAGKIADAERTFRAILARDPLNANALNYLGYMLANRNLKVAEALTLVDRALAAEPDNPAFLDTRGWALHKLGRAQDAEEPLRRAATALRGSSVIQSHYAEVLVALGRHDAAAAALDLALAGDGQDVDRAALERRRRQLDRRQK